MLASETVEGYVPAVIETGLRGLVLETVAAVRQYNLQGLRDQIVTTDTVVVQVPARDQIASLVSLVYRSHSDLEAVDGQTTGGIETVPGHYGGTELVQDIHSAVQGVPSHNQFGMVLGID